MNCAEQQTLVACRGDNSRKNLQGGESMKASMPTPQEAQRTEEELLNIKDVLEKLFGLEVAAPAQKSVCTGQAMQSRVDAQTYFRDDHISIGLLKKAFDLEQRECFALGKVLCATSKTCPGLPVEKIEDYSAMYAHQLIARHTESPTFQDEIRNVFAHSAKEFYMGRHWGESESDYCLYQIEHGEEQAAKISLAAAHTRLMLSDFYVNKKEAVLALNGIGIPQAKEIPGLSFKRAEQILAPTQPAAQAAIGKVAHGTLTPGGSNPDTPRIEATQKALESVYSSIESYLTEGKIIKQKFNDSVEEAYLNQTGETGHHGITRDNFWQSDKMASYRLKRGQKPKRPKS